MKEDSQGASGNENILPRLTRSLLKLLNIKEIHDKPIEPNSKLREDLGIDSVDIWDLSVALEKEFRINIEDYEATWVVTVADLAKLISSKLADQNEKKD